MVRGLYTAWTGLRNEEKRMDVVTNNMANADTTGYKKVDVTSQSFDRQLAVKIDDPTIGPNIKQGIGGVNLGVKIGETYYDMSQGNFRQTEDQYNLALSGSGFFTISTTDKSGTTTTRYTRDGDFTVTRDGYLVTKDGGKAGGFWEKLAAAKKAGAEVLVIRRPQDKGYDPEEIKTQIKEWLDNEEGS